MARRVVGIGSVENDGQGDHARAAFNKINLNFEEVYSVFPLTEAGAVGDGATDDSAAITAAITALSVAGGGILFIPEGTFLVSPTTLSSISNVHIFGAGTIKVKSGAVCNALSFVSCTGISIDGIRFDGNKAATTDNSSTPIGLLNFSDCSYVSVRNCTIVDADGYGARYASCTYFSHIGNTHRGGTRDQVLIRNNSTDGIVQGNVIDGSVADSAAHMVNVEASTGTEARRIGVVGNVINTASVGVQFTSFVYDSSIRANQIKSATGANCIKLDATKTGIAIQGNTLVGGDYGVLDAATDPPTIADNTVMDAVTYGIRSSVAGVVILRNTVSGGNRGINTSNDNAVIDGNRVSGTSSYGIVVGDSAKKSNVKVLRNHVDGGTYGVYFRAQDSYCAGNTIENATNYPVYLIAATNSAFEANWFAGNGTDSYTSNDFAGTTGNTIVGWSVTTNNIDSGSNTIKSIDALT